MCIVLSHWVINPNPQLKLPEHIELYFFSTADSPIWLQLILLHINIVLEKAPTCHVTIMIL